MYHSRTSSAADLRTALEAVTDLDGLQRLIESARDTFVVDHMMYHWVNAPGRQLPLGTYPAAWQKRYAAEGFERLDPVVLSAATGFRVLNWKDLDWSCKRLRDFLAASAAHGVSGQGLSVPVHGPGGEFAIFTANHACDDDTWAAFEAANADHLTLLAHAVHGRARALAAGARDDPPGLSQRETEVIALIARGETRGKAARRLRISEHTLRDHLENARRKLGARNTTHAAAQAVAQGLVRL